MRRGDIMKWFNVSFPLSNHFVFFPFIFSILPLADYLQLCGNVPPPHNTTCSWRGFDERVDQARTAEDWFRNCGCYMCGNS